MRFFQQRRLDVETRGNELRKPSPLSKVLDFLRKNWLTIVSVIAIFIVWQVVVDAFHIKKYVLPSPKLVFRSLFGPNSSKYHWGRHLWATAREIFGSFFLVAFAGVTIAVILSWNRWLNRLIMPVLVLFNSIPKIALAPLFLIWLGYGIRTNIFIAFFIAFFPVVINATTGMLSVDEDLLDLVRYLDATKLQVFLKIRIPWSLPFIFSGLKISATSCVVGSIVGEFIASRAGLGYLMRDAQASVDMPTMFACLMLMALIGMAFFGMISVFEKVAMPYRNLRTIE